MYVLSQSDIFCRCSDDACYLILKENRGKFEQRILSKI